MAGVIIVRLAIRATVASLNNLYGVKNGNVIWRVQDVLDYNPKLADARSLYCSPYSGIDAYQKDERLVIAVDGAGFRYLIDPANGKIVGEESWVR